MMHYNLHYMISVQQVLRSGWSTRAVLVLSVTVYIVDGGGKVDDGES